MGSLGTVQVVLMVVKSGLAALVVVAVVVDTGLALLVAMAVVETVVKIGMVLVMETVKTTAMVPFRSGKVVGM